ncbi:MAG TPA: site-specific integrase [Acidimicrobiia bacterium]|nr:site-specific integrase [Acidimicrobiia bacterium]
MPGGPFTPPPCRSCGSTGNYYASGQCTECHLHGPKQRVGACRTCFAWGARRHNRWTCRACIYWNRKYPPGVCVGCGRTVPVDGHGACRLCLVTARRQRINNAPLDFTHAGQHQQLFLADMHKAATHSTLPKHPTSPAPAWPNRPVAHRQLVLFTIDHDLSPGRGVVGPPKDPALAAALDVHLDTYAARVGWRWGYTTTVRSGIRILLGLQDTPGAPITTSEAAVLAQVRLPIRSVLEVLAEVGMVEDDRTPAIQRWFDRTVTDLPGPMLRELHTWFDVMVNGHTSPPRTKPRSPTTIKLYTRAILPALHTWAAAGHESLREVTRADVLAILPKPRPERAMCGRGLKSLFGLLKAHKLIFTNPTHRVLTWSDASRPPLPIEDLEPIREALTSTNPARAALAALIVFHGLRTGELRTLQLTDIHDRRLHIGDRIIPLSPIVQQRLTTWLDHRQQRWPHTNNPHLFIHFRTAARTDPVGNRWVKLTLNLPGGAQALRHDRILDEAIATGGDTRRLCDLFGLSIQQASRYTAGVIEPALSEPDD